jgi:hypothetical protein
MKKLSLNASSFQNGEVFKKSVKKNSRWKWQRRDLCVVKVTAFNGNNGQTDVATTGSNGSFDANSWCVNYISSNPGSSCA